MFSQSLAARLLDGTLTAEDFAQLDPADRVALLRELVEMRRQIDEVLETLGFSGSTGKVDFERRGRPRVTTQISGAVLAVGTLTNQPCRVLDLSDTGGRLETSLSVKRNQVVVVTFVVGEAKHQLWASVRWVGKAAGGRRTVGIEFHHMSQDTQLDLVTFLNSQGRTG